MKNSVGQKGDFSPKPGEARHYRLIASWLAGMERTGQRDYYRSTATVTKLSPKISEEIRRDAGETHWAGGDVGGQEGLSTGHVAGRESIKDAATEAGDHGNSSYSTVPKM